MNKTERLAYEWLRARYGEVIYQKRAPTFLTDGGGFEVKRAYPLKAGGVKIIFQSGERERLIGEGCRVLVFSESKGEPVEVLSPEDLKGKMARGVVFHEYGSSRGSPRVRVSLKIDGDLFQRIESLKDHFQIAETSVILEMLLRRGYNEVSSELRLGRDISVIR
jgi:hypothetical protein